MGDQRQSTRTFSEGWATIDLAFGQPTSIEKNTHLEGSQQSQAFPSRSPGWKILRRSTSCDAGTLKQRLLAYAKRLRLAGSMTRSTEAATVCRQARDISGYPASVVKNAGAEGIGWVGGVSRRF